MEMKINRTHEALAHPGAFLTPSASQFQLPTPRADVAELWNFGVACVPLFQYLRWADDLDLFIAMADQEAMSLEQIVSRTSLSKRGAEALLGILTCLNIVEKNGEVYRLGDTAREYLDRRGAFYVGASLYGALEAPIPRRIQKGEKTRKFSKATGSLWDKLRFFKSKNQWGRPERLTIQHSRNFPAAVIAARSGHFDGLNHLVDVGGGSGVFAIPLALDKPGLRITLVELPRALPHIEKVLDKYQVRERVELQGFNVHEKPWPLLECDGILFGNFMHFCADDECEAMLKECYRLLPSGGRIFIHEMLWNDMKDGPLVTALWNFWLTSISAGRQRTREEFNFLLSKAGFSNPSVSATSGGFSLVVGMKV